MNAPVNGVITQNSSSLNNNNKMSATTTKTTAMKPAGPRKFYQLPDTPSSSSECGIGDGENNCTRTGKKFRSKGNQKNVRGLMEMVEGNIIGRETVFQSPFGPRRCVYMDHTASGLPLRCIEDYVRDHVLPYYGNTHTTSTLTSSQTTMFRHESKDIIRNAVGASEHDAVIFCGSGATAAIHKLINGVTRGNERPPPIVFIGPYEHHSNILPWRDTGAKMIYIPETKDGAFDIKYLEEKLKEETENGVNGRMLIGSFSIASNITGIPTDDVAVTVLMHKYGGLAFWDYSAAAPHVQIVMNPVVMNQSEEGLAKKDALYFSGHKFVGGPQTPGVLVAKKSIFENPIPDGGGGGTVFFVTKDSHRYLQNIEYREEGGTPAIVESIRLGLVFRLKDSIGSKNIIAKESAFTKRAISSWSKIPNIKLLGPINHPRIGIISFLIENTETGLYLHHNFVVALLNDLFGIQARGGCACAGPYGQSLLGINTELAQEFEELLLEDSRLDRSHLRRHLEGSAYEVFRPGVTRLSIPYHAPVLEADYIIDAVKLIAEHGYKLLPLYTCNPETGEFHHHSTNIYHNRKWLSWAAFDTDGIRYKERQRNSSEDYPNYKECLEQATTILTNAHNLCKRRTLPDQSLMFDLAASRLKWFMLPSEALEIMNSHQMGTKPTSIKAPKPFQVKMYSNEEERQSYSSFYPSSVPHQLVQFSWGDGDLTSPAKALKSEQSFLNNYSDVYYSSNDNDSDPELLIAEGTTVTGPSICFTSTNNNIAEKPLNASSISESSTVSDVLQESSSSNINGILNMTVVEPITNGTNQVNGVVGSNSEYVYSRTESTSSLTYDTFSQDGLSRHSSVDQQYNQIQNYQAGNFMISANVQQQSDPLPCNTNGFNGYMDNSHQLGFGYPMSPYSNPPNTPSNMLMGQCAQVPAPNNTTQMFQSQPSFDSTNFPFAPSPSCQNYMASNDSGILTSTDASWGHLGSPVMTPSPVPCYNNQVTGGNMADPNHNLNINAVPPHGTIHSLPLTSPMQSPHPIQPTNINSFSSQSSPCLASPTSQIPTNHTIENELVKVAMRRVTNEIANELKSEIRGVISQVEQGIDPDSCRERANSFSTKDKNMEALKRRARTLSGHILRFKRSETTDGVRFNNEEKSDSTDESSFASEPSSVTDKKCMSDPISAKPTKAVNNRNNSNDKCCFIKREKGVSQSAAPNGLQTNMAKWHSPPKNVIKATLAAQKEFSMINDGDKILVCLSGGKDSLSLLHTMKQMQYILAKQGIKFSFGAMTVDPKHSGYDPSPLIPYLEALGVPYFFEEQEILTQAMEKGPENVASICSYCSRMKRGRIYACARNNGYNVLALGQHLDDLAESFFMSVFHNGLMRTMKASYTVKEGDLRVIRPFVYVREKSLRDFAETRGLPIIPENCPACFDAPTERHRVKQLLAQQEILYPKLYLSLRAAMRPLMAIDRTGLECAKSIMKGMSGLGLMDDDEA